MALKRIFKNLAPDWVRQRVLKAYYLTKLKKYLAKNEFETLDADLKAIKSIVAAGDTVVDIGANFGFYALFLSRLVGSQGHVYMIEPVPLTFEILAHNIAKLNVTNATVLNYAICEKNGTGTMVVPKYESGEGDNYYQAALVPEQRRNTNPSLRHFPVHSRTLDSLLLDGAKKIDFMKIDVEGLEPQVLQGASALIKKFMPALFIEISSDPDQKESPAHKLFALLKQNGYSSYWYDGEKLRKRNQGDKSVNYFFLTEEQASAGHRAVD